MKKGLLFVGVTLLLILAGCSVTSSSMNSLQAKGVTGETQLSPKDQKKEEILHEVKSQIASSFGIPSSSLNIHTDMIHDLHADYMDVFDIIIATCGKFEVLPPKKVEITTIKDLTDYVYQEINKKNEAQFVTREMKSDQGIHYRGIPSKKSNVSGSKPKKFFKKIVFFGTDRELSGKSNVDEYFGGKRSTTSQISYGVCTVTIPATHKSGELEAPELLKFEFSTDPTKHIVLKTIQNLDYGKFFEKIHYQFKNSKQNGPTSQDAFVFIHGFNTSFSEAARRTAQLAFDIGFTGVPIMYSWPSNNSLLRYMSDRENVEWSSSHIKKFLLAVSKESKAKRLHLIAHSMGNQGLIRALSFMAENSGDKPLFENVILAAPDYDAMTFKEQIAPKILKLAKHWTLYVSDKDQALNASKFLASPRLGQPITIINGVDTIDASGIDVAPWSVPEFHSYYASKKTVIHDLISVIKDMNPESRNLALQRTKNALFYWKLKLAQDKGE